jgi:hypothetical protein
MLTLELAASVGALLSTSAVLYLATHPNRQRHNEVSSTKGCGTSTPDDFRGMKKYSAYHRIRYYALNSSRVAATAPQTSTTNQMSSSATKSPMRSE